ncbi:response regulator transcription factor [Fulvimonas soli]|jgi:two-component system capsular synthesis response regulator RcsB|nr:response regulator transcription factor [Fulvimonas soli]TNY26549.1 DNA-binding response regulator [Fulvimonas soli]
MAGNDRTLRIIVADDHPVVVLGIKALLREHAAGMRVVGEAGGGRELLALLARCECDLLITDYSMPDAAGAEDGMAWLRRLRREHPALPVIVLTMLRNPALVRGMLGVGVNGVVGKAGMTRELLLAIGAVLAGRTYVGEQVREALAEAPGPDAGPDRVLAGADLSMLSRREAEVVRLYASGLTVTQIAERVCRSVKTVSQQKNDAMRKLGLTSNSQLYEYARTWGLLT